MTFSRLAEAERGGFITLFVNDDATFQSILLIVEFDHVGK